MKKILITGASTGIGAETARHLSEGNLIFVHYFSSREPAEKVAADVKANGGKAVLIQADLSKEEGCRSLVQAVAQDTDRLDVLVNNAGGLIRRQGVQEYEWHLMEEVFALNTYSAMMVTSLCMPLLDKGEDPCIVNLTSIGMRHGGPTATIYAASKGALDSFTRGIAKELAPKVRVNALAPGVILTPFHDKVTAPEKMEELRKATPLQRNGEAIHVAKAVKFIIENDFLTGETIDINGGLFMR
jgi:3-oxoacyl-[acyl-carrier protein] reductase